DTLTFEAPNQPPTVLNGRFDETLKSQRLGRRGSTIVHQQHQSEVQTIDNPGGGDITISGVTLEPSDAPPIQVSAFGHLLPRPIFLAIAGALLVGGALAFDRSGALREAGGALTLSTLGVIGTAIVFWTSNAAHPDFSTLVGSAIFGGPLGFGAGALLWWIAKRVVPAGAR